MNYLELKKTDLTNILIRTAAKNEALLEAKISKKANKSKRGKKLNKKGSGRQTGQLYFIHGQGSFSEGLKFYQSSGR